jgi:hypothetical protein
MPYKVIKSEKPKGWFVVTTKTGAKHSKKPFKTKKEATQQLKALYVHSNPSEETGEGLKDIWENIKGRFSGIRDDYPPSVRSLLKRIAGATITGITIYRKPVQEVLTSIINFISFGQFDKYLKSKGYDKVYHLFAKIDYTINGANGAIIAEKNQTINIEPWKQKMGDGAEFINVAVNKPLTINDFFNNAQKAMGKDYFTYQSMLNNCQVYIDSLLNASGLNTPQAHNFIYQDVKELYNKLPAVSKATTFLTDTASKLHTFIFGKGLEDLPDLGI